MDVIIEILIYATGVLGVMAAFLWASMWLIGRVMRLLGHYKLFLEALGIMAEQRRERRRHGK